ncbi:MAG: rhodanese-related sulfurtransferase [Saprospiraceae bacterium]|jgi:rhodanese-related sulfurtransferase|tara:strand:- start:308 stop:622 length:315 start_codon:yes stop_codon:yes gene_type:complete
MFDFLKSMMGGGNNAAKVALDNGAVIIDVRTPAEFSGGHVKGAINIPLSVVGQQVNKIKKYNKPVVTCCRSGARSGSAASILQGQGIEVVNGGSWQSVQALLNE